MDGGSAGCSVAVAKINAEHSQGTHMKQSASYSRKLSWGTAILLSTLIAGCGGGGDGDGHGFLGAATQAGAGNGVGGNGRGPAPVALGAAGNFRILAQANITDVPA